MVRIVHNPTDEPDRNPGAEVFALQQDFQARLADETLRYLRGLRGLLGPASPGTVLRPQPDLVLRGDGVPGDVAEITFEVDNRQQVHVIATPMLTPLVRADGTAWFPDAVAVPASALLAPGAVGQLRLLVNVPVEAGPGQYDGALVLLGMKGAAVRVSFTVNAPETGQQRSAFPAEGAPAAKRAVGKRAPVKQTPVKQAPVKQATPAKKTPAKKTAATKTAAKKATGAKKIAKKGVPAKKATGPRRGTRPDEGRARP